jgi:hypothetical protein
MIRILNSGLSINEEDIEYEFHCYEDNKLSFIVWTKHKNYALATHCKIHINKISKIDNYCGCI